MAGRDRLQVVRDIYNAYESGDRSVVEQNLAEDFVFSTPPDVGIDRATYFERCWPASKTITAYEFPRLLEAVEEVIVTYEATRTGGPRVRNTEIFGFEATRSAALRSTSAGISTDCHGCKAERPIREG